MDVYARFEEAHQGLMGMLMAAYKLHGRKLRAEQGTLPLTIISGFLGSGKTTLLNHLLVEPHGRRLAVLVNDFGRINIDADLVSSQTEDLISLKNGCACCSVGADLAQALIDIADRDEYPDAIVLEASGIADTRGIIQVALTNPAVRLEGVVVVVDAETAIELAEDSHAGRVFRNQIDVADLVALSKLDLLDDPGRAAVKQWLTDQFVGKPMVEVINGDISADVVLGIDASQSSQAERSESDGHHDHEFESVSFTFEEPFDGERLRAVLDSLPEGLLRAKGIVHLAETPDRRHVYQRVGSRWNFSASKPWNNERPHSSLVFIGPVGLFDQRVLEENLSACLARKPGEAT